MQLILSRKWDVLRYLEVRTRRVFEVRTTRRLTASDMEKEFGLAC